MNITINIIYLILLFVLALIVFKYLETYWSYKVYKPHLWEKQVENKILPKQLQILERNYYDKIRFYNMWFQIERIKKDNIKGAFVELGVHKGETAKLIYEMLDTQRTLHLFDTFEGFTEKDLQHENKAGEQYNTAMFADTSLVEVKKIMNADERVVYHKGYFPDTAMGLEVETFAFVHLDADLYLPTIEALRFFYPRLSPGGVIIIHDYNHIWEGIKKALDEFLPTIPESIVELADWKGSVMIVKNKI